MIKIMRRVKDYLEAAREIRAAYDKSIEPLKHKDSFVIDTDIEIAKMIQLEEHKKTSQIFMSCSHNQGHFDLGGGGHEGKGEDGSGS